MTLSRISERVPPEQVTSAIDQIKNESYPNVCLGGDLIYPRSLNIGTFTLNRKGFHLMPARKFYFK